VPWCRPDSAGRHWHHPPRRPPRTTVPRTPGGGHSLSAGRPRGDASRWRGRAPPAAGSTEVVPRRRRVHPAQPPTSVPSATWRRTWGLRKPRPTRAGRGMVLPYATSHHIFTILRIHIRRPWHVHAWTGRASPSWPPPRAAHHHPGRVFDCHRAAHKIIRPLSGGEG
jgi:hypothetical protein